MKQNRGDDSPLPLPLNWDRCQAYNKTKRRYCRQNIRPIPNFFSSRIDAKPIYCGNHVNLYDAESFLSSPSPLRNSLSSSKLDSNNHILPTTPSEVGKGEQNIGGGGKRKDKGRRIPCPLDPSHTIYESQLKRHIRICPKVKKEREERSKPYFREDINKGGCGDAGLLVDENLTEERRQRQRLDDDYKEQQRPMDAPADVWDVQQCQALALRILDAYTRIFVLKPVQHEAGKLGTSASTSNKDVDQQLSVKDKDKYLRSLTGEDLYKSIPLEDLFDSEKERGMEELTKIGRIHGVKMGGSKHVRQIGSIVGHIRRWGLLDDTTSSSRSKVVLEMGAGRGTTGFVVASAFGATATVAKDHTSFTSKSLDRQHSTVRLVMVEKSGSRAQVDKAIRRQPQPRNNADDDSNTNRNVKILPPTSEEGYLNVEKVTVSRIRCDLAHVHLPSALDHIENEKVVKALPTDTEEVAQSRQRLEEAVMEKDIVVIAKHLCGAGTDLALKSIQPISMRVRACILATCCHGVCTWDDYVGRKYLRDAMTATISPTNAPSFDQKEFNLMKRWAAGTVLCHSKDARIVGRGDVSTKEHSIKLKEETTADLDVCNIKDLVSSMNLQCGVNGLGRACQRLIDYGRCQYMEKHLFTSKRHPAVVEMCHYVASDVTPQNALLKAINN